MDDLRTVAYFFEEGTARMLGVELWTELELPAAVEGEMIAGYQLWKLLVAPDDYERARDFLSRWDKEAWAYLLPDELRADPLSIENARARLSLPARSPEGEEALLAVRKALKRVEGMLGEKASNRILGFFEGLSRRSHAPRPEASVIILMHDKWEHTRRCLYSLLHTTGIRFELVLVDNGSREAALKEGLSVFLNECLFRGIPARLLTFSENVGAVRGRNKALPYARGDFIAFMDNDVVVRRRSWLRKLVDFLKANPLYGAVGPKLIYPTKPYIIQCAGCEVSPTGRVNFRGRGEPADSPEFCVSRDVQCLISACIVFPAHVVRAVGELDMAYHPVQFEDIDYCYRIKEKGYKLRYLADVEMYHFENVTTGGTPRLNYTYLTVKNGKIFKDKWRHVFEKEGGPPESSMVWKDIPTVDIEQVGEVEMLD